MADYYSILNKTITGLAKNTPEVRQAVYSKARSAIEAQLRKMDPPPAEELIANQLELLEEAILVIDSEYAPDLVSQELDEIIEIDEPATVSHIDPPPEAEPAESAIVAPVEVEAAPAVDTDTPAEPPVAPAAAADEAEEKPKKKSRKLVKLLVYLLIFGLLGGAGYAAWLNRSALEPMIASVLGGGESQDAAVEPEAPAIEETAALQDEQQEEPEPEPDSAEKEPVRLGTDGEDQQAEAPQEPENELETTEVPVVLEPTEEPVAESEPAPEVEPVNEETAEENSPVPSSQPESTALGEVAYLYEEGSAGSGASRSSATISWTLAMVKPSDTLPPEPVIVGNMEVPEKDLSVELNIKRNVDPALSASHIIELTFGIPDGFSGGGIDNIARFVMKPTEEARGEPLVAVPVKVSDGYFLIALDNLDQAVEVNNQLLLTSDWIDIPIAYNTGKRALLTLEKGGTGDQVFKEAFDDWKNR